MLRSFRIAHLSDLHFGKISAPGVVDALVEGVNDSGADLVAVSGDLTQRARPSEFGAASSMIRALAPPVLVVPGNHDVYPWWRPLRRLGTPFERYQRFIGHDVAPTFQTDGVAVLGLNSAYSFTIKGGRINAPGLRSISAFFGGVERSAFKVVVVHHPLSRMAVLRSHDVARKAVDALKRVAEAGGDLILCGHLHISHIEPLEILPGIRRSGKIVMVGAGTSTSSRGRRQHRATNFYNLIEVTPDAFTIEERRYIPREGLFVSDGTTRFERWVG